MGYIFTLSKDLNDNIEKPNYEEQKKNQEIFNNSEIELDLSVSCLQNIYAETYNPYVISIIFLYIINVELDIFILLVYSRNNNIN